MVRLWEHGENLESPTPGSSSKAKDLSSLCPLCATIRLRILDHQRATDDQDQLIRNVLLSSIIRRGTPRQSA